MASRIRTTRRTRRLVLLLVTLILLAGLVPALGSCGGRGDDEAPEATANTAPPVSLEGYAEVADVSDLSIVRDAKFASLMLMDGGSLRTYMVTAGEKEFESLATAVAGAVPVRETVVDEGSSLVVVLRDATLLSFGLDRGHALLSCSGTAWRPADDFQAVLEEIEGRAP